MSRPHSPRCRCADCKGRAALVADQAEAEAKLAAGWALRAAAEHHRRQVEAEAEMAMAVDDAMLLDDELLWLLDEGGQ